MKALYELRNEYEHILYKMQTGTPEMQAEASSELAELEHDIAIKAQNCVSMLKTLESEAEAIDIEIERLKSRSQSLQKQAQWLDWYIGKCLDHKPLKAGIFNIGFRKSKKVKIIGDIPEQYMRTKTVSEPDKILIKKDLEMGAEIPGAVLEECFNLTIK